MNQGKLEVVKQKIARVNIDILGIRDLKCTAMCEFNSDDNYIYYYIYYCGQESLRRNGAAIIVTKEFKMHSVQFNPLLGCNFENYRMISVHFQGKTLNITVMQFKPKK